VISHPEARSQKNKVFFADIILETFRRKFIIDAVRRTCLSAFHDRQ
jgi:hypothetical protein